MKIVRLRAMEPADLEMLYLLENDVSMWPAGSTTAPYSRHTLLQYIETTQNDVFADGQLRMVVTLDGQAAGCADLYNVNAVSRHAEVALGLLPGFRGDGVGQEAMRQLVSYALDMLGLRTLIGIVGAQNKACIAMMERVGFAHAGLLKKWIHTPEGYDDGVVFQLCESE